jgi:hypothetical protein
MSILDRVQFMAEVKKGMLSTGLPEHIVEAFQITAKDSPERASHILTFNINFGATYHLSEVVRKSRAVSIYPIIGKEIATKFIRDTVEFIPIGSYDTKAVISFTEYNNLRKGIYANTDSISALSRL